MILDVISCHGQGGLWLMPHKETINARTYMSILKEKLPNWMTFQGNEYIQQDGAPFQLLQD